MMTPLPPPLPPTEQQMPPEAQHESVPDAPVIMHTPPPRRSGRLITFVPSEIVCGTSSIVPIRTEKPMSVVIWAPHKDMPQSYTLSFRIDDAGRPLGIKQQKGNIVYFVDTSDLAPAFATWKFASDDPRSDCSVTFDVKNDPFESANQSDIHRHVALSTKRRYLDKDLFEQSIPDGSSCFEPYFPQMRVRVFPRFKQIEQAPGTASYSFVRFDIDESGKPIDIEILSSGGNRELDKAALDSMRETRFQDGPRTGCTYRYYRTPNEPLSPPLIPEYEETAVFGSKCEASDDWEMTPVLTYPDNFRKRWIEGWAVVRFDVAPWGETGNISVVNAEPSEVFGEEAIKIVNRASKKKSENGYSGCTTRVRFKMPDRQAAK